MDAAETSLVVHVETTRYNNFLINYRTPTSQSLGGFFESLKIFKLVLLFLGLN